MYKFYVKEATEIDIQRICDEAESDVVLLTGAGGIGLLLVQNDFLRRFTTADKVMLAGEELCCEWGFSGARVIQAGQKPSFNIYGEPDALLGWRAMLIDLANMGKIAAEVKTARNYKRRIQVKVHYL